MDYGLDMLAAYFVATDTHHNAYVYREVYQSGLIISEAAKTIRESTLPGESIRLYYAPPDLWNKRQDTGKSASEIFSENRIHLYKASNERVQGWLNVKEWLKPVQLINEQNGEQFWTSRLKFFPECRNLIRCLGEIQHDEKKPNDVATEPHELTHGPDALRYFLAGRPARAYEQALPQDFCFENDPDGGLRKGNTGGGWYD
jgi:phage terminase large subunit